MMEQTTFGKADILLVTDGLFSVSQNFINRIEVQKKEKGCSIHALIIGSKTKKFQFCDHTWHYSENGLVEAAALVTKLVV